MRGRAVSACGPDKRSVRADRWRPIEGRADSARSAIIALCSAFAEIFLYFCAALFAQADEHAALVARVLLPQHESTFLENAEPAQAGGGRRGRSDARARDRDILFIHQRDIEVEQNIPGRLTEQIGLAKYRHPAAAVGIGLARNFGERCAVDLLRRGSFLSRRGSFAVRRGRLGNL